MSGGVPAGLALDNWLSSPYSHWAFQHVEDFMPTTVIARGTEPVVTLPADNAPIADIGLTSTDGIATTVGAVMAATATDGWAVAHRGALVAEQYLDGLGPRTRHLLFSVSKSLVAAVVGALHGAGAIELDAPVTAYVPALADCGYAGATVRHLLDMRSGVAFSENYDDPAAEIHVREQVIGWAPKRGPDLPATLRDYLLTLRRKSAHGGPFEYRSCETDVLGWICEAAAGQPMPELMSELLWSRIGAQCDATIALDVAGAAGTGIFDGGISACLTDMIRFGSLYLRDGVSLAGQQVVPRGLDRRHLRRRPRLASGVRRQPRRQPDARRDVPQPSVVSLPGQQCRVVRGHVRPADLRQPRRGGGRRQAVHPAALP